MQVKRSRLAHNDCMQQHASHFIQLVITDQLRPVKQCANAWRGPAWLLHSRHIVRRVCSAPVPLRYGHIRRILQCMYMAVCFVTCPQPVSYLKLLSILTLAALIYDGYVQCKASYRVPAAQPSRMCITTWSEVLYARVNLNLMAWQVFHVHCVPHQMHPSRVAFNDCE